MGVYLEPLGKKEEWVRGVGEEVVRPQVVEPQALWAGGTGSVLVCMVENPHFIALAVATSARERDRFIRGAQGRRCVWFLLPAQVVRGVESNIDRWMKDFQDD